MQSRRTLLIGLTVVIVGVIAFVFLRGKNKSTAELDLNAGPKGGQAKAAATNFDFAAYEKDALSRLPKEDVDTLMIMRGRLNGRGAMNENLLVIAKKYEDVHEPVLAGYYYRKLADLEPDNAEPWIKAGTSFFDAEAAADNQDKLNYFIDQSYSSLEKGLELRKNDIDGMTDQGVNILEKSMNHTLGGAPMQGIGLLMNVLQLDSNNRKALNYLGLFSMQSQQFDRAIMRFNHLIALGPDHDPNYPYYFRYIADAYLEKGQKDKAKLSLEKYKSLVNEPALKTEADSLIQTIK